MSAFSELLTNYVAKSGLTKNGLIEACQVNRFTFFQCLNGKRLPKESFFEHLLRTLQLSPGEESKLRKLYHIAQIGESVYQNRQCAKKCLETLAALSGNLIPQIYRLDGVAQLTANWASLEGDNRVFQELCHLVQAEMFLPEPKIDLFVPQEDSRFIEYLKVLYRNSGEKNVRLRQLVQFPQGRGKKTRESMEFFDSILFFLASDCMGYEAHYYYSEVDFADTVGVLYPYSVITSTGVLLMNEAMDRALFSAAPAILETCRTQFEDVLCKTKQFHTPFKGYQQTVDFTLENWEGTTMGYQYFATPCFSAYLTRELVDKYCPAGMEERFDHYFQSIMAGVFYVSFCSEAGLMDFARNGLMNEFPEGLVPPLELEDRKTVLETMLYRPPENSRLYLMDPEKTTVSDEFVFSLAKGKRIMTYRKRLPKLRMFCFQEQNLMDAFEDFFESLPESSYVLPRSEVERVLRQAIRCCEEQMTFDLSNQIG